jgi:hypothetical protein
MNKIDRHDLADQIASSHGCVIEPCGGGHAVISVLGYCQQGYPQDGDRIARCRAALRDAGVEPHGPGSRGYVSEPVPAPMPKMIMAPQIGEDATRRVATALRAAGVEPCAAGRESGRS